MTKKSRRSTDHRATLGPMAEARKQLDADDARLLKLEEKVAYQDKLLEELNDVIVSLHRRVDELRARLDTAEGTMRQELGGREMVNEKPPHY